MLRRGGFIIGPCGTSHSTRPCKANHHEYEQRQVEAAERNSNRTDLVGIIRSYLKDDRISVLRGERTVDRSWAKSQRQKSHAGEHQKNSDSLDIPEVRVCCLRLATSSKTKCDTQT